MNNNKNCPNCGAPYDIKLNKCPYCGTSYYDFSALDLTGDEPFYLKIKTEINGKPCYVTQLVLPNFDTQIEFGSETTEAYDACGIKRLSFISNRYVSTNLSFRAIEDKNGNLFKVEVAQ